MMDSVQLWLATPEAAQHFDPARLTDEERERMTRLRGSTRRQEFAVSRALRAHVLRGERAPANESLSHSGGYAALARAHPELQIGVDLESHRSRDVLATARTAFTAAEARTLEAADGAERARLFYTMWTVKEALAKALQLDLMDALRSCELMVDGTQWRARAPTSASGSISVYQPGAELTLAVVCIGAAVPVEAWSWPPQQPASWPLIAAIAL